MAARKRFIVANWKMNPTSLAEAKRLFSALKKSSSKLPLKDVLFVLCPPSAYLGIFKAEYEGKKIALGTQDIFYESSGAFTGEQSAELLKSVGARFAIVGHSERRALGETDDMVARKVAAALRAGLRPVVCIGERVRDERGDYLHFLEEELRASLKGLSPQNLKDIIVAYEPVWAIGKDAKEAMKPADVHETTLFVRKILAERFGREHSRGVPVLYGGSVSLSNAGALLARGGIDGLLIGRESLDVKNFSELLSLAGKRT